MAGDDTVNPVQVQKFLSGIDYPVRRAQLVEHARGQGADERVTATLERLPDREYNGPNAVSAAIGDLE